MQLMKSDMCMLFIRLAARLPLGWLQNLGRVAGLGLYVLPGRYARRLRENAAQAGYTSRRFRYRAAAETGAMIMEIPRIWLRTKKCTDLAFTTDQHVLEAARRNGKGIIFLTPHLGCFEVIARYLAQDHPLTVMYRPARVKFVETAMRRSRQLPRLITVPASFQGVRQFLKTLRAGGDVGLLPDQVPKTGDGTMAPFFGRDAYTVTLPGKLARQTGATIVMAAGERLSSGKGWRIHFVQVPALPETVQQQAALINHTMELLIRRFPEQYLWGYHRYKVPDSAKTRHAAMSDAPHCTETDRPRDPWY